MAIDVTHYSGVHQGGTKEYHLYMLTGPTHTLILKRFGKTAAAGQIMQEIRDNKGSEAYFDKLLKERDRKGYDMRRQATNCVRVDGMSEFLRILPVTHRTAFTAAQVAKVEGKTVEGVSGPYDPLADERAAKVAEMMAQAEAEKKAAAFAEQEAELNQLKSNPNFGMF